MCLCRVLQFEKRTQNFMQIDKMYERGSLQTQARSMGSVTRQSLLKRSGALPLCQPGATSSTACGSERFKHPRGLLGAGGDTGSAVGTMSELMGSCRGSQDREVGGGGCDWGASWVGWALNQRILGGEQGGGARGALGREPKGSSRCTLGSPQVQ